MSSILLLILGVTYAYFTANISGTETDTTITVTGGTMNITFIRGSLININNIIPQNEVVAVKNFTVTGNNTTDSPMDYNLALVVTENTFSKSSLCYKLQSINSDSNGKSVPEIDKYKKINTGISKTYLAEGSFNKTEWNLSHEYFLEIYFLENGENQNIDQNKNFKAYLEINAGKLPGELLEDIIFTNYGEKSTIVEVDNSVFEK